MTRAAGSFRDPAGQVFLRDGRVFRTVHQGFADRFRAFRASPLYDALCADGAILPAEPVPRELVPEAGPDVADVLEQPRIPFIAYPYEWCFSQLRDAALVHLRLQRRALAGGFVLRDATPFNVQFHDGRLVHIDLLSFEPYVNGMFWTAYRQFVEQFLNPLLLTSLAGVPFHPYVRGRLDGLPAADLARLLPWRSRLRPGVLKHVVLFARVQKAAAVRDLTLEASERREAAAAFTRQSYARLLGDLERVIEGLAVPASLASSGWSGYAASNSYEAAASEAKSNFVRDAVAAQRPAMLWDLGGNTGRYSRLALEAGASAVVLFDGDAASVDRAYAESHPSRLNLLPLVMDFMNPTPALGWRLRERQSLDERGPADMFLALALVHHLCLAHNVPLEDAVSWLAGMGRCGVVEFVPKDDEMGARLLSHREDIFPGYDEAGFERALRGRFEIIRSEMLPHSSRRLYYVRRLRA